MARAISAGTWALRQLRGRGLTGGICSGGFRDTVTALGQRSRPSPSPVAADGTRRWLSPRAAVMALVIKYGHVTVSCSLW